MNHNTDIIPTQIKSALNIALKYLARQPRTVFQVKAHMEKKGVEPDNLNRAIKVLLERKYLDDDEFTCLFLENRTRLKPKSKFAYKYELKQKGICPSVIDAALSRYDDEDLAVRAVKSKVRQWQNIDAKRMKTKIMNFLRYRGFDYQTSVSALNVILEIMGGEDEN